MKEGMIWFANKTMAENKADLGSASLADHLVVYHFFGVSLTHYSYFYFSVNIFILLTEDAYHMLAAESETSVWASWMRKRHDKAFLLKDPCISPTSQL